MTDGQSPNTGRKPQTIAQRLLSTARKNPTLRAHLIERWARAETWTVVEGVALAWTIDPSKLRHTGGVFRTVGGLPDEAKHYLELARRSGESRSHTPSSFIQWAHGVGLAFHSDWHKSVDPAGPPRERATTTEADRRRKQLIRLWALSPCWSLAEGVALACNLDPKQAVRRSPTGYDSPRIDGSTEQQHLLDLAYRAFRVGQLDDEPTPVAFMRWARTKRVEFHPDWWEAVEDDPAPAEQEAKLHAPASELGVKERDSLLKMVVGMAIGGYGWDPHASRNPATTEITDDLVRAGVPLDADTVRKWLKTGADLVPRKGD